MANCHSRTPAFRHSPSATRFHPVFTDRCCKRLPRTPVSGLQNSIPAKRQTQPSVEGCVLLFYRSERWRKAGFPVRLRPETRLLSSKTVLPNCKANIKRLCIWAVRKFDAVPKSRMKFTKKYFHNQLIFSILKSNKDSYV